MRDFSLSIVWFFAAYAVYCVYRGYIDPDPLTYENFRSLLIYAIGVGGVVRALVWIYDRGRKDVLAEQEAERVNKFLRKLEQ